LNTCAKLLEGSILIEKVIPKVADVSDRRSWAAWEGKRVLLPRWGHILEVGVKGCNTVGGIASPSDE
jgi:hypothetical protein